MTSEPGVFSLPILMIRFCWVSCGLMSILLISDCFSQTQFSLLSCFIYCRNTCMHACAQTHHAHIHPPGTHKKHIGPTHYTDMNPPTPHTYTHTHTHTHTHTLPHCTSTHTHSCTNPEQTCTQTHILAPTYNKHAH